MQQPAALQTFYFAANFFSPTIPYAGHAPKDTTFKQLTYAAVAFLLLGLNLILCLLVNLSASLLRQMNIAFGEA
ncbi:MAG: hypothetical protein GY886_06560 [Gammaproteobacteria bacterium]|nr:hypothetical protein [Gammaproteobacteria bacterium]